MQAVYKLNASRDQLQSQQADKLYCQVSRRPVKIAGWYCGKDHHEHLHNVGTENCHVQDSNSQVGWGDKVPVKYQCSLCKSYHTSAWQSGPNEEAGQMCEVLRK